MNESRISELLGRVAARDEAALGELYRAFGRKVYGYAFIRLRDRARAEEVVVDTMHDLWRKADAFRGESRFATWLIGMARNNVLMALRKRDRHEKPELAEDFEAIAEAIPEEAPSPFDVLVRHQEADQVRVCLDALPGEQREAVHLFFFEGMSLVEVAACTACPEGTVKTRLFHARRKLRECLTRALADARRGAHHG